MSKKYTLIFEINDHSTLPESLSPEVTIFSDECGCLEGVVRSDTPEGVFWKLYEQLGVQGRSSFVVIGRSQREGLHVIKSPCTLGAQDSIPRQFREAVLA